MGNDSCKCCDTQTKANEIVTNTGPPNIEGTPKNRDTAPLIFSSKARKTSEKYEKNVEVLYDPKYYSPPIIIDNGSLNTRIGISEHDQPKFIFPTLIGAPESDPSSILIGSDAVENKTQTLRFQNPFERGLINDWQTMKIIWQYCFDKLQYSDAENCSCLLTEPVDNPTENRLKTCEYFFEHFNVGKFLLINQSVLSFYNTAKTNGVIIDSGHAKTQIVPIYDGYALHSNVSVLKIAGVDVQNHLINALNQITRQFTTRKSLGIVSDIIKTNCYCALDYEKELSLVSSIKEKIKYSLPDGQEILLGEELFQCTEILFNPKMAGVKGDGVPELLDQTFKSLDNELALKFADKITFAGGTTFTKRFVERVRKNFQRIWKNKKFAMSNNEANINSSWNGGALISKLGSWENEFVDKGQYNEYGPIIIQRKCIY